MLDIVSIFVSNLVQAYDFYCNKLKFKSSANFKTLCENKILYFYVQPIDVESITSIRIQLSPSSNLLNLLTDLDQHAAIKNVKIENMYSKIVSVIPEYVNDYPELPSGYMSSLKKSANGLFFSVRDPFGNFLTFSESDITHEENSQVTKPDYSHSIKTNHAPNNPLIDINLKSIKKSNC